MEKKKRYISFNQKLIDRLTEFGFKRKNMDFFKRKVSEDITQSIIFGHTTQGRKHVKFYYVRINIEFPKVLTLAKDFDLLLPITAFWNSNIGELMPIPNWLEWPIGEDTDEKYDNKVVDSMLHHIKKYALPFLNHYNTPAAIIEGIKKRAYRNSYGEDYHACAILFLYGKKEDFDWFVEQRSYEKQFHVYDPGQHWDYRHPTISLNDNCMDFLNFAEALYTNGEKNKNNV